MVNIKDGSLFQQMNHLENFISTSFIQPSMVFHIYIYIISLNNVSKIYRIEDYILKSKDLGEDLRIGARNLLNISSSVCIKS